MDRHEQNRIEQQKWEKQQAEMKRVADEKERNARMKTEAGRRSMGLPAPNASGCFPAGTPVLCPNGQRPIEGVEPGDLVFAVDVNTGKLVARRVLRIIRKSNSTIWDVTFKGSTSALRTTAFHRLRVGAKWLPVRALVSGQRVLRANNTWAEIADVRPAGFSTEVFNLIVDRDFSYVAGGCVVDSLGSFRAFKRIWHIARAWPSADSKKTVAVGHVSKSPCSLPV